jgi:hypothetical protein
VQSLVRSMLEFNPRDRPTFKDIIDHQAMKEAWHDRNAVATRRRERIRLEDTAMRWKWDFCDDAYEPDAISSSAIVSTLPSGKLQSNEANPNTKAPATHLSPTTGGDDLLSTAPLKSQITCARRMREGDSSDEEVPRAKLLGSTKSDPPAAIDYGE